PVSTKRARTTIGDNQQRQLLLGRTLRNSHAYEELTEDADVLTGLVHLLLLCPRLACLRGAPNFAAVETAFVRKVTFGCRMASRQAAETAPPADCSRLTAVLRPLSLYSKHGVALCRCRCRCRCHRKLIHSVMALLLLPTVAAFLLMPASVAATCPGGLIEVTDSGKSWCVKNYNKHVTFCEAIKTCHENGQEMISKSVHDAMAATSFSGDRWWVGLVDALNERDTQEDGWVWIKDGQVTDGSGSVFLSGEPNNLGNNQDCATIKSDSIRKLRDETCNELNNVFCYEDAAVANRIATKATTGKFVRTEIVAYDQPDPGCWIKEPRAKTHLRCSQACLAFEFEDCIGYYWHPVRRQCVLLPYFDASLPLSGSDFSANNQEKLQWMKYKRIHATNSPYGVHSTTREANAKNRVRARRTDEARAPFDPPSLLFESPIRFEWLLTNKKIAAVTSAGLDQRNRLIWPTINSLTGRKKKMALNLTGDTPEARRNELRDFFADIVNAPPPPLPEAMPLPLETALPSLARRREVVPRTRRERIPPTSRYSDADSVALRRIIEEARINQSSLVGIFVDFLKAFDSLVCGALLRAYNVLEQLIFAIMAMYQDTTASVMTRDGLSDQFSTVACCRVPFLLVLALDWVLRTSLLNTDDGFLLRRRTSMRHPEKRLSDIGYADDLALLSSTAEGAQRLLDGSGTVVFTVPSDLPAEINYTETLPGMQSLTCCLRFLYLGGLGPDVADDPTWTLTDALERQLDAAHAAMLHAALRVRSGPGSKTSEMLYARARLMRPSDLLRWRRLQLAGHVISTMSSKGTQTKKGGKKKHKKMTRAERAQAQLAKMMEGYKADQQRYKEFVNRVDNWFTQNCKVMLELFTKFDRDGNGTLDYDEFKAGMLDMNIPCNLIELHLLCTLLDADGNGDIDYDEFGNGIKHFKEVESGGILESAPLKIVGPREQRFVSVLFRFLIFEQQTNHPGHFEQVVPLETHGHTLVEFIRKRTKLASKDFVLFFDNAKTNQLDEYKTLEDHGIHGGPEHAPKQTLVFYDFRVDFESCPVLMSDYYFTCHENGQEMISKSVHDAMAATSFSGDRWWVGLIDALNERGTQKDGWVWIKDGQVTDGGESYFYSGEPNNEENNQDCVTVRKNSDKKLRDETCNELNNVFCYEDAAVANRIATKATTGKFVRTEIVAYDQPSPGCWIKGPRAKTHLHCSQACLVFEFEDCIGYYWHPVRRQCVLLPYFDASLPLSGSDFSANNEEKLQWMKYKRIHASSATHRPDHHRLVGAAVPSRHCPGVQRHAAGVGAVTAAAVASVHWQQVLRLAAVREFVPLEIVLVRVGFVANDAADGRIAAPVTVRTAADCGAVHLHADVAVRADLAAARPVRTRARVAVCVSRELVRAVAVELSLAQHCPGAHLETEAAGVENAEHFISECPAFTQQDRPKPGLHRRFQARKPLLDSPEVDRAADIGTTGLLCTTPQQHQLPVVARALHWHRCPELVDTQCEFGGHVTLANTHSSIRWHRLLSTMAEPGLQVQLKLPGWLPGSAGQSAFVDIGARGVLELVAIGAVAHETAGRVDATAAWLTEAQIGFGGQFALVNSEASLTLAPETAHSVDAQLTGTRAVVQTHAALVNILAQPFIVRRVNVTLRTGARVAGGGIVNAQSSCWASVGTFRALVDVLAGSCQRHLLASRTVALVAAAGVVAQRRGVAAAVAATLVNINAVDAVYCETDWTAARVAGEGVVTAAGSNGPEALVALALIRSGRVNALGVGLARGASIALVNVDAPVGSEHVLIAGHAVAGVVQPVHPVVQVAAAGDAGVALVGPGAFVHIVAHDAIAARVHLLAEVNADSASAGLNAFVQLVCRAATVVGGISPIPADGASRAQSRFRRRAVLVELAKVHAVAVVAWPATAGAAAGCVGALCQRVAGVGASLAFVDIFAALRVGVPSPAEHALALVAATGVHAAGVVAADVRIVRALVEVYAGARVCGLRWCRGLGAHLAMSGSPQTPGLKYGLAGSHSSLSTHRLPSL
uniref:C-type lectin domain-containing protein n=1 Tax=Macrostomum lignano TaxID=282301 RepID=A0A1I8I381_9PLAT